MKDTYTKAILELIAQNTDISTIAEGFMRVLRTRGHEQLAVPVWQAVLRTIRSAKSTTGLVFVVSKADAATYEADITATLAKLGSTGQPEIVTDETLIGGFVVEANSTRVDKSYKKQLINLYRSITT